MVSEEIKEKLSKIKILITDCDGVLTDGKIYYGSDGSELKAFHVHDGKGFYLIQEKGIICAIITGRQSAMVERRAQELGIEEVYQAISDKLTVFNKILRKYDLTADQAAYIGDDINDRKVLQQVGFSATVADGVPVLKNEVDFVTEKKGGRGAVREITDLILRYGHQEGLS